MFITSLKAALVLHFAFYNFRRIHKAIRRAPAMATGVAQSVWELRDLLNY